MKRRRPNRIKCKPGYYLPRNGAVCQKVKALKEESPESLPDFSKNINASNYNKIIDIKGIQAVSELKGINLSVPSFIQDPEGVRYALQQHYVDMLNATGFRRLIPNIYLRDQDSKSLNAIGRKIDTIIDQQGGRNAHERKFNYICKQNNFTKIPYYYDLAKYNPHNPVHKKITIDEFSALRQYGRPIVYKYVNGLYRFGSKNFESEVFRKITGNSMTSKQALTLAREMSRQCNSGLKKLPIHKGYSYRGLNLPEKEASQAIKKGVWRERGFLSSTADKNNIYPGNVIVRLNGRTGRDISGVETMPNREVLFPRNTVWKVKGRKVQTLGKTFYLMDWEQL